jgi:ketosteroid isomerase-like protein
MTPDFDQVVERSHAAVDEFVRGNSKPLEHLYSRQDDVTLGNPFGPFVRGFDEVAETMERAATYYRDGKAIGFELVAKEVTQDLAFVVEVERVSSKIGGSQEGTPVSLRVTSIFRNEDGEWKLLHRHADPITSSRPAESVVQT